MAKIQFFLVDKEELCVDLVKNRTHIGLKYKQMHLVDDALGKRACRMSQEVGKPFAYKMVIFGI